MKYFKKFPVWTVVSIFIGLAKLLPFGFGLIPIGLAVWGIMSWRKRPTDQEIDLWIGEEIKKTFDKALTKTGTEASQIVGEKVVIRGFPSIWQLGGATVAFIKGKDDYLRFTPLNVHIINFTENQLISYGCDLDLSTGKMINESTDEYFYKDVVSVSTKTKNQTVKLPDGTVKQDVSSETFELTTSGGTSISVRLTDPETVKFLGGGQIQQTSLAESAIQTVRKMLREKKGDGVTVKAA